MSAKFLRFFILGLSFISSHRENNLVPTKARYFLTENI